MSEHFWFTVLGPVRAQRGSTEIELGSRQQRAVLAVLLLRENGHASLSELIEAVWGTDPPRTAGQTIRTYIHRLRKSLGPAGDAGASFIVSAGNGYALRVSPDQLDLSVFRQRVAMAEGAAGTGQHTRAVAHLRDALDLWRGEPLAGIPGTWAMSQRNRLEALHLVAVERHINVEYELGRFGEATAELFDLVAKHPLNERFREMLMFSLCKTGRQAEALAVYREVCNLLSEDLGIEPGPRLQVLHERVLRADPELLVSDIFPNPEIGPAVRESPADTAPEVSPPQAPPPLPADVPMSVSGDHELAVIDALLSADAQGATAAATGVIVVMAGVGKTTPAVHWAHRIGHRFPDGHIYLDLRGSHSSSPAMTTIEASGSILRSLGVSSPQLPADMEGRTTLYHSLLSGRRILLVLDNVRDAEQIRPLLPGTSSSLVVVTS
ncbi:AfsR/SARP family transcriptional regulator [Actinacidiphila glaucinigra]|uniref:AfsR/SARP family transcriptional regulator n=1 Tax=Actinacidiphila glaucinigra TaxID=235986 RepID=UPI0035D9D967